MGREHDRQDMPRDQDRQGMGREQEHPREMRARRDARSSEELPSEQSQAGGPTEEKAPSFISKLFPPPPTLIKESLSRYKPAEGGSEEIKETSNFEETIFEHPNPSEGEIDDENEE
ncbi:MAG: hypothetical protein KGQ49_01095 [Verrucomicrobia bacterium]|nr:hypothetical protein [Verrucomicrobiota bacterium]